MRICETCGCPAHASRSSCGWCGSEFVASDPVNFVVERSTNRFRWSNEGAVVAEALMVHGVWKIHDARGGHVVTLMPLAPTTTEQAELALVGPTARLIGTVDRDADERGWGDATARDGSGQGVLVMRSDGPTGGHVVDRDGEIVAIASWDHETPRTDLLVTARGALQPLSLLFGLVLAIELERPARRPA